MLFENPSIKFMRSSRLLRFTRNDPAPAYAMPVARMDIYIVPLKQYPIDEHADHRRADYETDNASQQETDEAAEPSP